MVKETGVVNIHGKDYKTVALRVSEFREKYPIDSGWTIDTSIIHADDAAVCIRAEIINPEGKVVGAGHGEEQRSSSQVNKTSALENAETSAIGRALASIGFGGTEYASANEVTNAIHQQTTSSKPAAKSSNGRQSGGATKKQLEFVTKLYQSHVWTEEERTKGLASVARWPKDRVSKNIDAVKNELERRKAVEKAVADDVASGAFDDDGDLPF